MKEITYNQVGDYQLPNLKIGNEENPLGKYAMLRMNYLKTNQPAHLFALRASNTLNKHLKEVEEQAQAKMEKMMEQMLVKHPAPSKEKNSMQWVQHMNILKAQIEEVILQEIIYN
ncbi:TnpV protein [Clostridium sp. C1]|uniref:TnpV protein n=1 Tax=Clostridium sp. C1 TaxID=1155388 RepID=UPI001BAD875C|nr:TnpV protein [Clostridium sp. C1]QUN13127.1 TnpV protein [Clostridium sp. C1]